MVGPHPADDIDGPLPRTSGRYRGPMPHAYHPRMTRGRDGGTEGAGAADGRVARCVSDLPQRVMDGADTAGRAGHRRRGGRRHRPRRAGHPGRRGQVGRAHPGRIGRWWLGPHQLDRSPFQQAKDNKYALAKKIASMPGWPNGRGPQRGPCGRVPGRRSCRGRPCSPIDGGGRATPDHPRRHGAGVGRVRPRVGRRSRSATGTGTARHAATRRGRPAWSSSRHCWRQP